MTGAIPPLPQYVFMVWCLVKQRDNFTFAFTSSYSILVAKTPFIRPCFTLKQTTEIMKLLICYESYEYVSKMINFIFIFRRSSAY
jgi:hypothetical protein